MTHRGRRAVLLVSVLFLSLVIAMFVEAALALAPSGFTRAALDSSMTTADQAARSGVDWARSRLSADPRWNASVAQTFNLPGLFVKEGQGQVEGWIRENTGWARFRLRFNYQDGPAQNTPNSDGMDDPSQPWNDFPYVSVNNLDGGADRQAPVAASGSSSVNQTPWPTSQVNVPRNTMLLSIEGASGAVLSTGGQPTGFHGGAHKRTVQTILKFSSNQPMTDAAVMSAGDLKIDLGGAALQLSSIGGETARIRSKGFVTLGDVVATKGDLRYGSGMVNGTVSSGTSTGQDGSSDGFYQIPASKVRPPSGTLTLAAGTYTVDVNGNVMFYDMDYKNFVTASPAPTGSPVSPLPSGITVTADPTATPKVRLHISSDLKITNGGVANDFAIIPDGGAPQSDTFDGVAAAPTPPASGGGQGGGNGPQSYTELAQLLLLNSGNPLTVTQAQAQSIVGYLSLFTTPTGDPNLSPNGSTMNFSIYGGPNFMVAHQTNGAYQMIANVQVNQLGALQPSGPLQISALNTTLQAFSQGLPPQGTPTGTPTGNPTGSPTGSPPASTALSPSDLELNLQGGTSGITLANNNGSVTLGAQIQGQGAAIVSSKNINLIGTSTDLSSTPGTSLGLNLYAQGHITVDAYRLDSSGGTFHGVNMRGILYAWQGIDVFASNGSSGGPFKLVGAMIAYGGDPNGSPSPGLGPTTIKATSADVQFDPSFVAGLVQGGPFTFKVLSWHEF